MPAHLRLVVAYGQVVEPLERAPKGEASCGQCGAAFADRWFLERHHCYQRRPARSGSWLPSLVLLVFGAIAVALPFVLAALLGSAR